MDLASSSAPGGASRVGAVATVGAGIYGMTTVRAARSLPVPPTVSAGEVTPAEAVA